MPHIHDEYDFTVSAFILHPTDAKIFLHKHLKLGKWLQPGGHVELTEDPWQALTHELEEEVGLDLSQCEILNQPDAPHIEEDGFVNLPIPFYKFVHNFFPDGSHKHIDDTYLLKSYTDDVQPAEGESQDFGWFSIEEIRDFHTKSEIFDNTLSICEWISAKYF